MAILTYPRSTTIYKLGGTETLRASSAAFLEIFGGNLQNISDEMRRLFWADEGYKLVQVDQSGAEALIVAYLCTHGKFRDLFLNNVKPHVFVAMNMFLDIWIKKCHDLDVVSFANTPIPELKTREGWKTLDALIKESDKWKPQERYYYIAKMICHASNYGIRGNAFRLNVIEKSKGKIVLTKQQADTYLAKYHALFPEIQRWHREVEQQLQLTGVLYNLQGFPRVNTGKLDDYNMKDWYAFAPQSTVGLITHKEITNEQTFINVCNNKTPVKKLNGEVDEALQRFGLIGKRWTLLNNCHDSSLTQVPDGEERECAAVKRFFMQQNLVNFRGEKFQMKSEAAVGRNWGKYKKDKNEEGMKEL